VTRTTLLASGYALEEAAVEVGAFELLATGVVDTACIALALPAAVVRVDLGGIALDTAFLQLVYRVVTVVAAT
jgi:hypothetical protein